MSRTLPIALSASFITACLSLCGMACGADVPNQTPSSQPTSEPASNSLFQAAESLEARVRPLLPKGWSVSRNGPRVLIERERIVAVFNMFQLPHFESDAARREYVRPNLREVKFALTLRVDDRMLQDAYTRQRSKNGAAVERARRDENNPALIPDDAFWQEHAEYGFRELPWLDSGSYSIYADCSVYWLEEFWDADDWAECDRVVKAVAAPFRAYTNDFQFFIKSSRK